MLIRLFLIPGVFLFPVTYFVLVSERLRRFRDRHLFLRPLTVAQFSFVSEFLPRVFPLHLRGTGGSFATNFGGRMIGTMAATLNTEVLAPMFTGENPMKVAKAAAVIGGGVYAVAFGLSFLLPQPPGEMDKPIAMED